MVITNEKILEAIEYGLTVAHIKYNNKDYYGELMCGGLVEKTNLIELVLVNLLKPNNEGLWKITNLTKSFNINNKNCTVLNLKSIEGQNGTVGWCELGFIYIAVLSEHQDKHPEKIFIKSNSYLPSSTVYKIQQEMGKLSEKKIEDSRKYDAVTINQYILEIKRLKELLHKKKIICTECSNTISYNNNFPAL